MEDNVGKQRFLLLAVALLLAFASTQARAEICIASHYGHGDGFNRTKTASGGRVDTYGALAAAHRTRAFGSLVMVRNLANGKAVQVTINDRGPWKKGRCIDLTYRAARAIGMGGLARVEVK